jgi:23S rRNA (guanosine2251-2'-O)-methyltransferase
MIISGVHPIKEALASGKTVAKIIVSEDKNIPEAIYREIRAQKIPIYKLPPDAFKQKFMNETGFIAILEDIQYTELEDLLVPPQTGYSRILIIDEIEDPQNVGAMIRSSVGFNFNGIILTTRRTVTIGEGTVRASAGTLFLQKISRVGNLSQTIDLMQERGFWIVGTSVETKLGIEHVDLKRNIALIMGNEEKGVRQKILEKCDYLVKIPIEPVLNSLNVSVAYGILAYEIARLSKGIG